MLIALALATLPLAAQSDVVALDPVNEPHFPYVRIRAVRACPGGGAVTLFTASAQHPVFHENVLLRRSNENGDRICTVAIPSSSTFTSTDVHMVQAPTGETFLLVPDASGARIVKVDRDGQLAWDIVLDSPVAGFGIVVDGIGVASDGHLYVGGVVDSFLLAPFAGRAVLLSIDEATGAERWRRTAPAIGSGEMTVAGGDAYFAYIGMQSSVVERIDATGNAVYSAQLPATRYTNVLAASDSDTLFVQQRGHPSNTGYQQMLLDASGATIWTRSAPGHEAANLAAFLSNGDVAIVAEGTTGYAVKLDGASGVTLWRHDIPASLRAYTGAVLPLDAGGLALGTLGGYPSSSFGEGAIEFLEANGQSAGVETFTSITATGGGVDSLSLDERGNIWAGVNMAFGWSSSSEARIVKLVLGGDPSQVSCAQPTPNSTGLTSRLRAAGPAEATRDNVTLVADQIPPNTSVLFLNAPTPGSTPQAGGSAGTLCLGASIARYVGPGQIRRTNPIGQTSLLLELTETPGPNGVRPVMAGQTMFFQAWHRDSPASSGSNFTNAIRVDFL